jgi:uncharacterized protein YuzE
MRVTYDREADAIYVWLRDVPYAYGRNLDESRRVDYAADHHPIGIEFLDVSQGVDLRGLPDAKTIASELRQLQIPVAV